MAYSLDWIGQLKPEDTLRALASETDSSEADSSTAQRKRDLAMQTYTVKWEAFFTKFKHIRIRNFLLLHRATTKRHELDLEELKETYEKLSRLSARVESLKPADPFGIFPTEVYCHDLLCSLENRIGELICPLWNIVYPTFETPLGNLLDRGAPPFASPYPTPSMSFRIFRRLYHEYWSYTYSQKDLSDAYFKRCWRTRASPAMPVGVFDALPYPRRFMLWCVDHASKEGLHSPVYCASMAFAFDKVVERFHKILGWRVLRAWRTFKQRIQKNNARFISLAIWFAYYKMEGFYANRILPYKQIVRCQKYT